VLLNKTKPQLVPHSNHSLCSVLSIIQETGPRESEQRNGRKLINWGNKDQANKSRVRWIQLQGKQITLSQQITGRCWCSVMHLALDVKITNLLLRFLATSTHYHVVAP